MLGNYSIQRPHYCCSLTPPPQSHISCSSPSSFTTHSRPYPITLILLLFPNHPFALLLTRVSPATFYHYYYFIFIWFIFHKTSASLWTHITRGWVGHLKASSCHRWITPPPPFLSHAFILVSRECRPSHASAEPTGVRMTVLCSQTAMNNETEVRYEVADAGRREGAPTLANVLSSRLKRLDPCTERQLQKRINQTLLQQGISLCLEPLMFPEHRTKRLHFLFSSACEFQHAAAVIQTT